MEELEGQRNDLEEALSELRGLIRETDRRIRESFEETFEAAARNFEDVIERLFPGGSGRLRRVSAPSPRWCSAGRTRSSPPRSLVSAVISRRPRKRKKLQPIPPQTRPPPWRRTAVSLSTLPGSRSRLRLPARATKRLSLLSGGEKSLVALAFMFAVFLARPCPFYILDEVEAALDDANIDRFLTLVGSYADRSQFIVITHQRRTMEAADVLYGVSMGGDGVSKVVSRRLEAAPEPEQAAIRAA